ncbi:MAG TPA: LOG family protein, partial [Planctomycetota bacterium]|nr:LOG family protein [Planctomycetota bacterium]
GGGGTLDELGDLWALKQNGFLRMPVVVVNVAGYFDEFLAWVGRAEREGFLYGGRLFAVRSTAAEAVRYLKERLGGRG